MLGVISGLEDASFLAAMKSAYAGFLRCGGFTVMRAASFNPAVDLTRGAVAFVPTINTPTHVLLSLPSSKTDPFRKGVSVLLAAAPGAPGVLRGVGFESGIFRRTSMLAIRQKSSLQVWEIA